MLALCGTNFCLVVCRALAVLFLGQVVAVLHLLGGACGVQFGTCGDSRVVLLHGWIVCIDACMTLLILHFPQ